MKTAFSKLLATTVIGTVLVVCATETAAAANRNFWLANEGWGDVRNVYITPTFGEGYSDDLLGEDIVEAGDQPYAISPRGFRRTCVFDIEITKSDGYEIILEEVDLCDINGVVVNGHSAEVY